MKNLITIIKKLEQDEISKFVEMRKNSLEPINENKNNVGLNRMGKYGKISKTDSSTSQFLKNQFVLMESDLFDIRMEVIGNIDDAYISLIGKIKTEETCDFQTVCKLILETVNEYFGFGYNFEKRMEIFKPTDEVRSTPISEIKGQNIAMCTERAMLSQNLLKFIGIDSTLKISQVYSNGYKSVHAYNIVKNEDSHYIFDSTNPKMEGSEVTPIITEITKEAFDLISKPLFDVGASIEVIYDSPRSDTKIDFIYDSDREYIEKYDYTNSLTK